MSDYFERTRNCFLELKKIGIRKIRKSCLGSLKETVSKSLKPSHAVGFGMLAIVAYGIYTHQNENRANVEKGLNFMKNEVKPVALSETDGNVLRLNEMLEKHAWSKYHAINKKKRFQNDEQPQLELDWSRVDYIPDKVCTTEKKRCDSDRNHVIYNSIIENHTNYEQKVVVSTQRDTESFYKYSVTKGFTNNTKTELPILPIDEQVKSKLGLNNTFSLQSTNDKTVEKKQKWRIAEKITVPRESKTMISILVEEKQKEYDFNTWVAVKGDVNATFYDKERKQKLLICKFPMQEFIDQQIKENSRKNDNGTYKLLFCGLCEYRYGIRQQTKTKTISVYDKILKFTQS